MKATSQKMKWVPDDSDLSEADVHTALLQVQWVDLKIGGVRKSV